MLDRLLNCLNSTQQKIKTKRFWLYYVKETLQIIMLALLIASILYSTKIIDRIHNWENNLAISGWIRQFNCSIQQESIDNLSKESERIKDLEPEIIEIIQERKLRLNNLCNG